MGKYVLQPPDFTDYSIGSSSLRLAEHEFLISFRNDCGAAAFTEWWLSTGAREFKDYVAGNIDDLREDYG